MFILVQEGRNTLKVLLVELKHKKTLEVRKRKDS